MSSMQYLKGIWIWIFGNDIFTRKRIAFTKIITGLNDGINDHRMSLWRKPNINKARASNTHLLNVSMIFKSFCDNFSDFARAPPYPATNLKRNISAHITEFITRRLKNWWTIDTELLGN